MIRSGSCFCGGVVFETEGPVRDVTACHCSQCRRTSGHYVAASTVPLERFRLVKDASLAWYRSSPAARRGFCRTCGASLFWAPEGEARMSFAAGALDGATGLSTQTHIFTEDAGDYYTALGPPPAPDPAAIPSRLSGTCLCGACRFSLPGPAGEVWACHCTQCRKLSGHYAASFDAEEVSIAWQGRAAQAEYVTPGRGQRGFCERCGSSLYFRDASGGFSVEAGAIEGPTGGRLAGHIFVADKGDYYAITDGLPQFPGRN